MGRWNKLCKNDGVSCGLNDYCAGLRLSTKPEPSATKKRFNLTKPSIERSRGFIIFLAIIAESKNYQSAITCNLHHNRLWKTCYYLLHKRFQRTKMTVDKVWTKATRGLANAVTTRDSVNSNAANLKITKSNSSILDCLAWERSETCHVISNSSWVNWVWIRQSPGI